VSSLDAAGFEAVTPYHVLVPSFGDWGFVYASAQDRALMPRPIDVATRYLDKSVVEEALTFEKDLQSAKDIQVSSLDHPVVHEYYLDGWSYWH
jgi:spermidine synthase